VIGLRASQRAQALGVEWRGQHVEDVQVAGREKDVVMPVDVCLRGRDALLRVTLEQLAVCVPVARAGRKNVFIVAGTECRGEASAPFDVLDLGVLHQRRNHADEVVLLIEGCERLLRPDRADSLQERLELAPAQQIAQLFERTSLKQHRQVCSRRRHD
jgi:hypothetical protein